MKICVLLFVVLCGCTGRPLYDSGKLDCNVVVKAIHGRSGQILRSELQRMVKDYPNHLCACDISIDLKRNTEGFAYNTQGIANRLEVYYEANVNVIDAKQHQLLMHEVVPIRQSSNISDSSGEIIFSLYSDYEYSLLKKLAYLIFERINMRIVNNENRD